MLNVPKNPLFSCKFYFFYLTHEGSSGTETKLKESGGGTPGLGDKQNNFEGYFGNFEFFFDFCCFFSRILPVTLMFCMYTAVVISSVGVPTVV